MLLSNVLDTKGEGVAGDTPFHARWGLFVRNSCFCALPL